MYYEGMTGLTVTDYGGIFATVTTEKPGRYPVLHYPWRPREGNTDAVWPILLTRVAAWAAHAIPFCPDGKLWLLDGWPRAQSFDADGRPSGQVVPAAVDMAAKSDGEPSWRIAAAPARHAIGHGQRALQLAQGTTLSG
jgi:hypothetical protein